jgi:heptosyltransferase-3
MKRILVIRRDNIGDLVCTTPLLAGLRLRYPDAWLGALVNSYNAPVLERNPDVDEVIPYTKLKHAEGGKALVALGSRVAGLWRLRRMGIDCVLLATPEFNRNALRQAGWVAPRAIAGVSDGSAAAAGISLPLARPELDGLHEVERVYRLGAALGVSGPIPPLRLVPEPQAVRRLQEQLRERPGPCIAVQISARRPNQRWPAERFVELITHLQETSGATCMLLWSPGSQADPRHPGDDEKAQQVAAGVPGARLLVHRTASLAELIAAIAAADLMICSDGGASHIAAALGKPVVCLFGDSPAERWHPWGVEHRVLQPASRKVEDISVQEVLAACAGLSGRCDNRRTP